MYWFAYWYKMFWPKWHEINNMEKYYNKVHITFSIFQDCRIISDFIKKKKKSKIWLCTNFIHSKTQPKILYKGSTKLKFFP